MAKEGRVHRQDGELLGALMLQGFIISIHKSSHTDGETLQRVSPLTLFRPWLCTTKEFAGHFLLYARSMEV